LWTSVTELGLFLVLALIAIVTPNEMTVFWMFTPHVARAVLGFVILFVRKLPKTSDIVNFVEIQSIDSASLESLEQDFGRAV